MKKFISIVFLFAICLTFSNLQAQSKAKSFTTKGGLYEYTASTTGSQLDTVSTGETLSYTFLSDREFGYWYNANLKFTGTNSTQSSIVLKGRNFTTDNWTTITTTLVNSPTDSVINYQQITTKQYYRYLQFVITPAGSGGIVKCIWVKLSLKQ